MTFLTPLDVRPVDAKTWKLLAPLVYQGTKGDRIEVATGETTDFATSPWVTWMLFPPTGAWTKASVIHDDLCNKLNAWHRSAPYRDRFPDDHNMTPPTINAVDTDGIFRVIMREEGVGKIKRWLMWTGVRWGALANPARRSGWLSTAPAVLGISALVLTSLWGFLSIITGRSILFHWVASWFA